MVVSSPCIGDFVLSLFVLMRAAISMLYTKSKRYDQSISFNRTLHLYLTQFYFVSRLFIL